MKGITFISIFFVLKLIHKDKKYLGGGIMIHKFCMKIASSDYVKQNYKGIEIEKIEVGFEILFENITKVIIIMCCAMLAGVLRETIIAITVFAMLRLFTFGMHAQNSVVCTFISLGINVITPMLIRNVTISSGLFVVIMLLFIALIYKYAPADTDKHPLIGVKKRRALRLYAVGISVMLMVFGLLVGDMWVRSIVMFMEMYVVIGILPITYKILKRRYNNYEEYEKV